MASKKTSTGSFSGASGLLFHRNFIDSLSDFSKKLSKDFESKYGIPVKFYFNTRNMGEISLGFRPLVPKSKLRASGITDPKGLLKQYIQSNIGDLDSYVAKAIKATVGKPIMSSISITADDKERTTSWIGDIKLSK